MVIGVICIDVDGTIAEYTVWKGWQHIGKPIVDKNGISAKDFLIALKEEGWIIIIHSTRGAEQLADYMVKNELPYDYINVNPEVVCNNIGKPIANIYLDDRGMTFTGDYALALEMIKNFKPWCGSTEPLVDDTLHKEEEEDIETPAEKDIADILGGDEEEGVKEEPEKDVDTEQKTEPQPIGVKPDPKANDSTPHN